MGSTIHPSCTAGGPGSGGWGSRQCGRMWVDGNVLERVSRVLLDTTVVLVSFRPLSFVCFMFVPVWKCFTMCKFVFKHSESVASRNNP